MTTPICDFVKKYYESDPVRMHMPGHKGRTVLGPERLDITEIEGAGVLYAKPPFPAEAAADRRDSPGRRESSPQDIIRESKGSAPQDIIRESEENAALIFGTAKTLYSAEGSSLCIRAMLFMIKMLAQSLAGHSRRRPKIAAARNAHKTFISAAALLDIDVVWMYSEMPGLVSCRLGIPQIEAVLRAEQPDAVYITSPDYLGNIADIGGIAQLCHIYGSILAVDNAHGAYLKFMDPPLHPMDLGADICCDSAHKTLPVLTGGAYLHISKTAPEFFAAQAEHAMKMFASTSPSYLILQSLDMANRLLEEEKADFTGKTEAGPGGKYRRAAGRAAAAKSKLTKAGYCLIGEESLKLTVDAKAYGYSGLELDEQLRAKGIYSEFSDPDYLVMMLTPMTGDADLERTLAVLLKIPRRTPIKERPPAPEPAPQRMRPADAILADSEWIRTEDAKGRILASAGVSCPPAVPISVCGEELTDAAIRCLKYYGRECVSVVKKQT